MVPIIIYSVESSRQRWADLGWVSAGCVYWEILQAGTYFVGHSIECSSVGHFMGHKLECSSVGHNINIWDNPT